MAKQEFVRWAVHPADVGRIVQLPGASKLPLERLPSVGALIVLPFLVDPQTREPCQVRVVEIRLNYEPGVHAILVTRDH